MGSYDAQVITVPFDCTVIPFRYILFLNLHSGSVNICFASRGIGWVELQKNLELFRFRPFLEKGSVQGFRLVVVTLSLRSCFAFPLDAKENNWEVFNKFRNEKFNPSDH